MSTPSFTIARRAAWWCFIAGVMSFLLLSAQALSAIGVPYEDIGRGSPLAKIHPGSWLLTIAYIFTLVAWGNPLRSLGALLRAQKLLAAYAACQVFVLVWAVAWHGISGAASIIDSLLIPFIGVSTLLALDGPRRYRCLQLIVGVLVLNALVALAESVLRVRLVPYTVGGHAVIEDIFRPSALFGHPLTNSLITAALLPAVLYLRVSTAWRVALALLLWVSLLAFGGRTAFVLATLACGLWLCAALLRSVVQGRYSYLQLTGGALVGVMGAVALIAAIAVTGIGERIFASLTWDTSASVRVQIWDALGYLDARETLVGVEPADMPALGARVGLDDSEAFENFWLVMYLRLGWMGFLAFAAGMALAFAWLWKSSRGAMRIAVCLFFVIASSNNSLATKTDVLLLLMLVVGVTARLPVHQPVPLPRLRAGVRGSGALRC